MAIGISKFRGGDSTTYAFNDGILIAEFHCTEPHFDIRAGLLYEPSVVEVIKAEKRRQKAIDRIAWRAEDIQRKAKGGYRR